MDNTLRPKALDPTALSVSDFMRFDFTESFSYRGRAALAVGQLTLGHYDTLMKTRLRTLFTLLAMLIASRTSAPADESGSGVGTALRSSTISGYVDSTLGRRTQPARRPRPTEQSGIVVHAWYPGYCDPPEPGVGPWCTLPRPYYGTFSVFTRSGHYVASASTAADITATFRLHLKPGRYIIVPDDPGLIDLAATVTVRAKHFTDVRIWITED
jgi:hypothetical protein